MKIYINNKPLYIVTEITENLYETDLQMKGLNSETLSFVQEHLEIYPTHSALILTDMEQDVFSELAKHFEIVTAAGGVVQNNKGEILLIFRNGKWDLPKGKLDEEETIEQCAVREVREETGLSDINLRDKLITTYHVYKLNDKNILKPSHWFKMQTNNTANMQPQTEEGIEELKWVNKEGLKNYYNNTFPAIVDVLQLLQAQ